MVDTSRKGLLVHYHTLSYFLWEELYFKATVWTEKKHSVPLDNGGQPKVMLLVLSG